MTIVHVALTIVLIALLAFFLIMWVRLVVDWIRVLQPEWHPRGAALVVAEAAYSVTDPPIKAVRRFLPPFQVGSARLEFSWSFVMLGCLALIWVVGLFV